MGGEGRPSRGLAAITDTETMAEALSLQSSLFGQQWPLEHTSPMAHCVQFAPQYVALVLMFATQTSGMVLRRNKRRRCCWAGQQVAAESKVHLPLQQVSLGMHCPLQQYVSPEQSPLPQHCAQELFASHHFWPTIGQGQGVSSDLIF